MKDEKSLTNKKFGRWKVQDDPNYKPGQRRLLCKCECGTVRMVDRYSLLSGKSKSCGCMSKEQTRGRYRDLTGLRFGQLIARERAGYLGERTAWKCDCDCGNTCIASAHDLVCGYTKSCGCLSKKAKDLTDCRIGKRLQALYPTDKRDAKGSVIWRCRCDCGNIKDISQDSLIHGNWQSCGCLKEETKNNSKDLWKHRHFYEGTCLEALEREMRSDNKSGYPGVSKTPNDKYRVAIGFCGKRYNLGRYDTFEEAVQIRKEAEKQLHKAFAESYKSWLDDCEKTGKEIEFYFKVKKTEQGFVVDKSE